MRERYNQLLEETKQAGKTKRRRKQIVTSGAVLTAEVLDEMDFERWLYEEQTSSESDEEDEHAVVAEDMVVLPRVGGLEADSTAAEGLQARTSWFHSVSRSSVGRQRGGITKTRGGQRGRSPSGPSRGRNVGSPATGNTRGSGGGQGRGRSGGRDRGRGRRVATV
ncbi:MAG: hypothetical protein M1823_004564 [Watsoniomyces obsoletus]|nr:MAG: hypothetical protein M1823_004564 [Watsoniomyces obsoletus]